ncbi:flagellar export chaperone FliS [Butyrivibrio sp. WCD3002]|jgi:flagellar protein FliS|uniref:flagellar export chaperone FliS n=1 Tax=Butyrivibrio sp. WCD3002 TaxID=1280676 RepID=UPI00040E72CA|nr:flagellar protein FliS [Butyrivibrio sp. WCD3002]
MTREKIQTYTRRITMANKTQMITILYEMVLDYIDDAKKAYEEDDENMYTESMYRAMSCIDELIHSLNISYELGRTLLELYLFEKRTLISCTVKMNEERLSHVVKTFESLRAAYIELEKKDAESAVMTNVPKVYAGLTYGRGTLSESVLGNVTSRGFMA